MTTHPRATASTRASSLRAIHCPTAAWRRTLIGRIDRASRGMSGRPAPRHEWKHGLPLACTGASAERFVVGCVLLNTPRAERRVDEDLRVPRVVVKERPEHREGDTLALRTPAPVS